MCYRAYVEVTEQLSGVSFLPRPEGLNSGHQAGTSDFFWGDQVSLCSFGWRRPLASDSDLPIFTSS